MNEHRMTVSILALLVACCIVPATLSHAKPLPPPQLDTIFDHFSELEEHFKSCRWNKALKSSDSMCAAFEEMAPQIRETIRGDVAAAFASMMTDLRKAILRKDMESTEACFIAIQKLLFIITDYYQYKVPPVLSIIDKYIGEAEEALKRNDFKRVESEMVEVDEFFYRAKPLLRRKGACYADIEEFETVVREVRVAENRSAAEKGIETLKKLSARFLELF